MDYRLYTAPDIQRGGLEYTPDHRLYTAPDIQRGVGIHSGS